MRVLRSNRPLDESSKTERRRTVELNSFLGSDAALLLFSGLGLVATGLAIVRDIPVQRRVVEQPASIER
jgi:hypothetical protein